MEGTEQARPKRTYIRSMGVFMNRELRRRWAIGTWGNYVGVTVVRGGARGIDTAAHQGL